jgi:predicted ATPase
MEQVTRNPFILEVDLWPERVPSFDRYPFSIPAVRSIGGLVMHPKVTYFIGENGSGKSTLLEAIAVAAGFNPEGGSRNFSFATRDSHSVLADCLKLTWGAMKPRRPDGFFLRAETFYNVATEIERLDGGPTGSLIERYGGVSLHEQSHGESFFAVLMNRFRGSGLYILDEPESALSPARQMSMLSIMHQLIGRSSQFIIATHSPIVMAYPDATIYHFSEAGIRPVEYVDTENYKVTKMFLTRREPMLRELLAEETPPTSGP